MKMTLWCGLTLVFLLLTSSLCAQEKKALESNNMKTLTIQWHRLMADGQTCPRCGDTEKEVDKASRSLEQSLPPLGIKVVLEKYELTSGAFQQDPSKSNRILINGRLLEEWLGLKVGQSLCCESCGDIECRTLVAPGQVYETIPADLIIKAGLLAASQIQGGNPGGPCGPGQNLCGELPSSHNCCPK